MLQPRLSKLERYILEQIANNTINTSECDQYWLHDWEESHITYSDLFRGCYSYWPDDSEQRYQTPLFVVPKTLAARRASFSRALHSLVENKHLVHAFALAWHGIGYDHGCMFKEFFCWQGQGRKKTTLVHGYRIGENTPRYRMLGLTDEGWPLARSMFGDDKGRCEHQRIAS